MRRAERRCPGRAAVAALLLVSVVASCMPSTAGAVGCRFKSPNAIMCTTGRAAATAYAAFGFDVSKTNLSYNRELMRQSGCGRPYGKAWNTVSIQQISHGRVALASGWVGVTTIDVNDKDIWYVASDYLDGRCVPFTPSTTTLPVSGDAQ